MEFVMNELVRFSKALADPTRWRIVRLVKVDALCVCELADILEMPQSSVSSHVQIIRKAGLLEGEKCGKWTYFRILPRYRKILSSVEELFPSAGETFAHDAVRAARRLEKRENSCCPGPVLLMPGRNPSTSFSPS
jgi:ArsR family transcriptional regulator, arsenate/arsenite/antimonite-responsive transcriptional repressor